MNTPRYLIHVTHAKSYPLYLSLSVQFVGKKLLESYQSLGKSFNFARDLAGKVNEKIVILPEI